MFFFEKTNQKTFVRLSARFAGAGSALALSGCATLDIAPAQFTGIRQVDYFGQLGLPDRPLSPTVFHVRLDPEGTPRVAAGVTMPAWLPGETPGRRPHRLVLKVSFTTAGNLSREATLRGGALTIDLYDCKTEAALDFLRLSPVLWHDLALPSAAATRAIENAAPPRTYSFFLARAFDPVRAGDATAEPVDLTRHPKDICFEIVARDRLGDRLRTSQMTIPAGAIAAAAAS